MGICCKQVGKMRSIIRKLENQLAEEAKLQKEKKESKKDKTNRQIRYIYDELKAIHKQYFRDWRFGQLCSDFFGWLMSEKKVDLLFPEEDKMIEYIREYTEISGSNN